MKTRRPTTSRRHRRAADDTAALSAERADAPTQSLETLHNPALSTAERGRAALGLQRAVGNAVVEGEVALKPRSIAQRNAVSTTSASQIHRQQPQHYVPATMLGSQPDNEAARLNLAPLEELFELYATTNRVHELPTAGNTYGHDWIYGSAGSGHIRHVIRAKLETKTNRPALRSWFLDFASALLGPQERKQDLLLLIQDVFAQPGWRAANQIGLQNGWPVWRRRYAELWNKKGQLFADLAHDLDPRIEPYVAAGIMTAETGQTFFRQGRVIARFEAHVFWRRWGNTTPARRQLFQAHFISQRPHRWRRDPAGAFQRYHGNQNSEWEVLDFARTLDSGADIAAVESASFGAGQTMGFNFELAGFNSALELLQHYQMREQAQIEGIFGYINTLPPARRAAVINGILAGNYLPLSQAYGPQNPAAHAQRIARAVARMRQVVTGGQQIAP